MGVHRFEVVIYIDDFIGFGTPDITHISYDCLYTILEMLGLTVSIKKLVPPGTQVRCLGVLIYTVHMTISIPSAKG